MLNWILNQIINPAWKPTKQDRKLTEKILQHQLSLIGKYDSPAFKSLPHICQINTIIRDSVVPGIYD